MAFNLIVVEMRIVAALGGKALLQRSQKPDADAQEENVRTWSAAS